MVFLPCFFLQPLQPVYKLDARWMYLESKFKVLLNSVPQ